MGGAIKKFGKNQPHSAEKGGKSHSVEKKWNGFLSHVRGFGCVENEVLSTHGKSW